MGWLVELSPPKVHQPLPGLPDQQQQCEASMARARATLADARRAIDDLRVDDTSKGDLIEPVHVDIC
jgi:signal transduction histidine kinase